MLTYCVRCVMPSTKPDLFIDEQGVCNACRAYENRANVDWDLRKKELHSITDKYKSKTGSWDCIIPVSGGKDSTFQVIKVLQLGLNPLCVTSSTCDLSSIGRANIENLKENVASDFLILGLYSDMKEADRNVDFFIKDLELKLKK